MNKSELLSCEGMKIFKKGDYERALTYFNEALRFDEDDVFIIYNKVCCLISLDRIDETKELFEKIVTLCGSYENNESILYIKVNALTALHRNEEVFKLCDEILDSHPDCLFALTIKGHLLANDSNHAEAMECFDKAITVDPFDFDANFLKAKLLYDLSKYEEAEIFVDIAMKINPNVSSIFYLKGSILARHQSDYKLALTYLEKAISLDPNCDVYLLEKAHILSLLNRIDDAKALYKQILRSNPDRYGDNLELRELLVDMLFDVLKKD